MPENSSSRFAPAVRWISILLLIAAVLLLVRTLPMDQLKSALEVWVADLGFWGPLIFGLIYVVATVLLIPASVLTLAAGAVFGLGLGLVTVSLASTTGAACAFLIARYLARERVQRLAQRNDKFGAIDDAISEGGWRIVAMLRLSPAVPFGLQNYLYGLTRLRFVPYVLTSWIAMLPGTLLYVYLGLVAGSAAAGGGGRSPAEWALLVIGLLATLGVTIYITKLAQKQLAKRTELRSEQNDTDTRESNGDAAATPPWRLAIVAVVLLGLAMFAQSRSEQLTETVRGWVGEVETTTTSP